MENKFCDINKWLADSGPLAIAVSGGVDSMVLAVLAHRACPESVIFHAVSPAVPPVATERVKQHATDFGWNLQIIDAGEFDDEDYVNNPVNRCFYCKLNLYTVISKHTNLTIVSGTNCDDLSDYRPGLEAADKVAVQHPWVEAGYHKKQIRELAHELGLHEVGELPASPCLSSRIETGISIDPIILPLVDDVEEYIRNKYKVETVRCRIRHEGVVIELGKKISDQETCKQILEFTKKHFKSAGYNYQVTLDSYQMGSAFLTDESKQPSLKK